MANNKQLEDRLARVEKELADLKETLASPRTGRWYHQIVGDFGDDPALADILRLGRLIRRGKRKM